MTRRLAPLSALTVTLIAAAIFAAPSLATSLIAPLDTCPNQQSRTASAAAQDQTMLCMTNFARTASGRRGL